MAFKTELEFQTWCLKALKKNGWFVRNIPDIGNVKKPFDASGNYNGKGFAFEFKLSKNKTEPSSDHFYKKLYPHQIASLLEFQGPNSFGKSFVICAWEDKIFIYSLVKDGSGLEYKCEIDKSDSKLSSFLEEICNSSSEVEREKNESRKCLKTRVARFDS